MLASSENQALEDAAIMNDCLLYDKFFYYISHYAQVHIIMNKKHKTKDLVKFLNHMSTTMGHNGSIRTWTIKF